MQKQNEALGVAFELPDDPTFTEVLAYDEQAELNRDLPLYSRLWLAARVVIHDWACDVIPLSDDLGGKANRKGIEVVKWVGVVVWNWRQELEDIPKN